jgi:hypothetical protein
VRHWPLLLVAVVIAVALTGCTGGSASSSRASAPTSSATGATTASPPTTASSTTSATSGAPEWPAPTASPQIAAAQSELGSVGQTVLTWSSATSAVGVSLDYIDDYTPASGFTVPAGDRAIELDLRVINAGTQPIDLSGWSIYADIGQKPLTPVTDSRYLDFDQFPPVAPNASGYVQARVLIPTAGGTLLIAVSNPAYPNQPATFAVTLS